MKNKRSIAWAIILAIVLISASFASGETASETDDKYAKIRLGKTNDVLLLDIEWHTPESYFEEHKEYVDGERLKATVEEIEKGETYITRTVNGNSWRYTFNSQNPNNNATEGSGNDPSEIDPDGYYIFNMFPLSWHIPYKDENGVIQLRYLFGDKYSFVSSEEEFYLFQDTIRATCDEMLEKGFITREQYEQYTSIKSALEYYVIVLGLFGAEDLENHPPASISLPLAPEPIKGKDHFSILYVGNSFLYSGDVPAQVSALSQMYGIAIDYDTIMPGGATLNDTMDEAIEKMQAGQYDYVVFQDYGSRPRWNERVGFFSDLKILCEEARKAGAIPVLYNPAWYQENQKPNTTDGYQDVFTTAYENAAKINGAILVNAAEAWIYAYGKHDDISLYKADDYHANNAGAYLTACVFASTLFDLHIRDIADSNIYHGDDAEKLGQAAWEYVSYYNENKASPSGTVSVPDGHTQKADVN